MANEWLRLWHDMPNDPKWRTVAKLSGQRIPDVIAVYVHMLVTASNAVKRGFVTSWSDEDVASALDLETDGVKAIREAMQGRVLEGDYLKGWERRQPSREDDSAERVRAYRERKKLEAETRNDEKRAVTQCNAPDKEKDTDKEVIRKTPKGVKKKSVESFNLPDWVPIEPWSAFMEVRKAIGGVNTQRALEILVRDLDELRGKGHDPTLVLEQSISRSWKGVFTLKDNQYGNQRNTTNHQPAGNQPSKTSDSLAALLAAGNRVKQRRAVESGEGDGDIF